MKRWFSFLILCGMAAAAMAQDDPRYTAAMVMEPTTGRILFEKNGHAPAPTASMTKMVTLLILLDEIKQGSLNWDTPVRVSAHASKMGGSQVFLKEGESFPVRDLAAATMIHSANDAAMALAEHIAGTDQAFVKIMNQKAQQMGLKDSRFYSPHGLPGEGDPDDVMSPWDLAIVGRELMKDPNMRQWAATQTMPFRNGAFIMYNPNHLLDIFPGASGIKTGFHNKAGFCVTGSAVRNNMELITVVMGSKQKNDNFRAAADLLSEAFSTWRMLEPVKKGQRLPQAVAIQGGAAATVPVVAGSPARVLVKRGEDQGITPEVVPTGVKAPVQQGQQVGWIVLKQQGKEVTKVPALAAANVAIAPWYKRTFSRLWPF